MTTPGDKSKDGSTASDGLSFGKDLKKPSDNRTGGGRGATRDDKAALRSRVPAGAPAGSRTLLLGTKPLKDVPKAAPLHKKPVPNPPMERTGSKTQLGMAPVKLPFPRPDKGKKPDRLKNKLNEKMSLEQRLAATIQREIMNEMAQSTSNSKRKPLDTTSETVPAEDPAPSPPEDQETSDEGFDGPEENATNQGTAADPEEKNREEEDDMPSDTEEEVTTVTSDSQALAEMEAEWNRASEDDGEGAEEGDEEEEVSSPEEGPEEDAHPRDPIEGVPQTGRRSQSSGKFDPSVWKNKEESVSKSYVKALWVMATILLAATISALIFLAFNRPGDKSAEVSRKRAAQLAATSVVEPTQQDRRQPVSAPEPPEQKTPGAMQVIPSAKPPQTTVPDAKPPEADTKKEPQTAPSIAATHKTIELERKADTPAKPATRSTPPPKSTPALNGDAVTIRVTGLQKDAVLEVNGEESSRVFSSPLSDKALKLEASLEGYPSLIRRIIPSRDKAIRMHLKKSD